MTKKKLIEDLLHITLIKQEPIKESIDEICSILMQLTELEDFTDEDRDSLINGIRNRVQRDALKGVEEFPFSAALMATGSGKSKIAVDRADKIVKEKPKARILLVVPTQKLRDENWFEEFSKWDKLNIWENNMERSCYASLHKYADEEFDYVILDEGHNLTLVNSVFFQKNKIHLCTILTATKPSDLQKNTIIAGLGFKRGYELSLDEATKLGLVAPYDIYVITMNLNNTNKYIKAGSPTKPFYQTEASRYKYLTDLFNSNKNKFTTINRMKFVYNLQSKTEIAKLILENVIPKELRTLIFCSSIKQAVQVSPRRFFSKPRAKKSDNAEKVAAIKELLKYYEGDKGYHDFKEKRINRLACINSLNEGENIADLDVAFIIQISGNELNLIQRIGRIIRYRANFRGKIIILCVEDSVDYHWMKRATANITTEINFIKLSRLRTGIETILFN